MSQSEIAKNTKIEKFNEVVYTPTTLLGVYASALNTSADGKIILTRGTYSKTPNAREYNGYYYDNLKSPNANHYIKIKVSSMLRNSMNNDHVYHFKGYMEKRMTSSSIELIFVVDDILLKEENHISEEELERFEILQQKISKGYRDLEAIIKKESYKDKAIKIANLYGSTAIVNKDFEKGLAEGIIHFNISDFRCNFTSKNELINSIKELSSAEYDVIGIVRGGGDKGSFDIFNDPEVLNVALKIKSILVTAIGHTVNETFLDKIADKSFALPHEYGNSLKSWIEQAKEEKAKSKSIFIEQVKQDLTKTFQDQIITLQNQLEIKNKEYEISQKRFDEINEQYKKEKIEAIKDKEKAFHATIKSLNDQIHSKNESLRTIQSINESSTKQQISLSIAEYKNKYQIEILEKEKLNTQLEALLIAKKNVKIYIVIAIIIGIVIGLLFR